MRRDVGLPMRHAARVTAAGGDRMAISKAVFSEVASALERAEAYVDQALLNHAAQLRSVGDIRLDFGHIALAASPDGTGALLDERFWTALIERFRLHGWTVRETLPTTPDGFNMLSFC
jgi:hypothetical protein